MTERPMRTALLVTNLRAGSVSERVKRVIEKALAADLDLEVAETVSRNHATELARDAAQREMDVVISFGGDGTMNEIANGLAGSSTALAVLPGGMANVLCRTLGTPVDIVEATGYLLNRLRIGRTRMLNIGRVGDRYFVLSCGIGLDAATVRKVEANPAAKRKYRDWYFLYSALQTAVKEYCNRDPDIEMKSSDRSDKVVFAIVSNAPRFTYFKHWPVTVAPGTRLEGDLSVFGMKRVPVRYVPRLVWSAFHGGNHINYKRSVYLPEVSQVWFAASDRALPVQVDGEFIGEHHELEVVLVPDGLRILS